MTPVLPLSSENNPGDATGDAARRWEIPAVALGMIVLASSGVLAFRGLSRAEARLFVNINSAPLWLDNALWPIMQCGTIWMAPVLAVVVAVRARTNRYPRWRVAVLSAAAAATVMVAWYLAIVTKQIVERGRPASYRLGIDVFGEGATGFGYVSGHTTVAFTAAIVLGRRTATRTQLVLLVGAAVVGLSRIVVGSHLPLDVVGGAGLGLICGGIGSLILDLLERVRSADGV